MQQTLERSFSNEFALSIKPEPGPDVDPLRGGAPANAAPISHRERMLGSDLVPRTWKKG
jgi:hypothetical protein